MPAKRTVTVYSEGELIGSIQQAARTIGSQRKLAKHLNYSEAFVSDLIHGRRRVSDSVLEKFGLERIIVEKDRPG